MRPRGPLVLSGLVVVVLGGAAVYALVREERHRMEAQGVPAHLVPASWASYRTSAGHAAHVGKKDVACRDCHAYEAEGFQNPGIAPCKRCHVPESTHAHGGGSDRDDATGCTTCHAFAPNKKAPTCIGCHETSTGHLMAIGVHATTACAECHMPHGQATAASTTRACTACHEERSTRHAAHQGSSGCSDCHAPHIAAREARSTCRGCHATPAGMRPANHEACVTCHAPHDLRVADAGLPSTRARAEAQVASPAHPSAQGVRATECGSCHAPKATLAASRTPEHGICTSCHAPHAPNASAPGACATCHQEVHVDHGRGPGTCIACHAPHGKDPTRIAAACTSCHQAVAATDGAAHAGKTPCRACHADHAFKASRETARCERCHVSEAGRVAKSKGHGACAQCHGGGIHLPQKGAACTTCHKTEAATAPKGHAGCGSCHETHGATVPAPGACATCHKPEAATKHSACSSCHRPHGPSGVASPPACTTCHDGPKLPALHGVTDHAKCVTCHTSHGPPRADRATCTTGCHEGREKHQPQAAVCNGCHVFRK
jgi:hypothetical protein